MSAGAETLTDRAVRATRWRFASVAVAGVSQLVISILLTRILTPVDFGVATLALVVMGLVQPLGDLGIGNAVVQRAELTQRHLRTAFTFSALLGVVIAIVTALGAPLGAAVTGDPTTIPILRVLSAGFAIRGIAVVAGALLRRRLDFKRPFFIETGSYLLGYGGVGVTLALYGYGVWSLVWGGLLQTLLVSVAQLWSIRQSFRPLLAWRELTDLLHFGVGSAASGSANYVALNGDNFVVGRLIGAASLGLYDRAYLLMNLPFSCAASVISSVMFPALTRVQGDPAALQRGFLLMTRLTAMVAAPSMATMAIVAPHLVPSLYGSQWIGVVAPLQILCMAGYFRALYHLGGPVAQSVGRVYSELWRQIVYAGLVIGGALGGAPYGLVGVAVGVSVAILYMFIATGQLALRVTHTPWRLYAGVQLGAVVTAAATCGVAFSVRLLLGAWHSSNLVITLGVLSAAAVPWSMGMLWTLGKPDCEPVLAHLPAWCVWLVDSMASRRRS